jgi:hypothetical protein
VADEDELDLPEVSPAVLVRVMYCSVCGSEADSLRDGRGTCCRRPGTRLRYCTVCREEYDDPDKLTRSGRGPCCQNVHILRSDRRRPAIDGTTPWKSDYSARAWVVHHPDGGTLEQIGSVLGITRERVRQIETHAKRKLRRACAEYGIDLIDVMRSLAQRDEENSGRPTESSNPLATGPSQELRDLKEAFPGEGDEDSRQGRQLRYEPLPEEFYAENNARALALFDALDLEHTAAALTKITARALAIEGVEDPVPFLNDNPWTPEQLDLLAPYATRTGLSLKEAARTALAELPDPLKGRTEGAVAQKILVMRKRLGIHTPRAIRDADDTEPKRSRKGKAAMPEPEPPPPAPPEVLATLGVLAAVNAMCSALAALPRREQTRALNATIVALGLEADGYEEPPTVELVQRED